MTAIRTFTWRFCVSIFYLGPCGIVVGGEPITHTIESERLAGNLIGETSTKRVIVHLPEGYEQSQESYPVVYWFAGANQVQTSGIDFSRLDDEFSSGRSSPAILVFMPGLTSFGSTAYLSSDAFGDWEGFLTAEVIPFIDETYRTLPLPEKRGAMGFSLGGFSAMTLPLVAPGTFGAVGANDPGTSLVSGFVRDIEEIPEGVVIDDEAEIEEFLADFPDTFEGYTESPIVHSLLGQIAARISPNPDSPLLGDLPFDRAGQWVPDARQKWREFDLLDPNAVELHRDALEELATLSIVLPQDSMRTNTAWNNELIRVHQEAGIRTRGIDFAGDHNDFQYERFTTLLSEVSYGLRGVPTRTLDDSYIEDFDAALGADDVGGVVLPAGWSVTDRHQYVFRDRTNTAFDGGTVTPGDHGPFILNAGDTQDEDRALTVYVPEDSTETTIQFLADVTSAEANALSLEFDIEAWDKVGSVPGSDPELGEDPLGNAGGPAGPISGMQAADVDGTAGSSLGEAAFHVVAELDFGDGFVELVDFGTVSTGPQLQPPDGLHLDGNDPNNRVSFRSDIVVAPISEASSLRLRWTVDGTGASQGWVFGLDDVVLQLLLLGDFDDDNQLSAADIDLLSEAVREGSTAGLFDLNGDDLVDLADRDLLIQDLLGTTAGDTNLDQIVDFSDFLLLANGFGSIGGWGIGDFDGSGDVHFSDFLLLAGNFEQDGVAAAVPEPCSTTLLLLSGLAAFGLRRGGAAAAVRRTCVL